ncbi:MAG: hypothetical protein AMXMBFR7_10720 [Planctomycetota bacterium]
MGSRTAVGIVSPGTLGSELGALARDLGAQVWWASDRRSPRTARLAKRARLNNAGTLEAIVNRCTVIVSAVPAAEAENVAQAVARLRFNGLYLELNALPPSRIWRIAATIRAGGGSLVDAALDGPPPLLPGSTRMLLSGPRAAEAAALFTGSSLLETKVLDETVGMACAWKSLQAAYARGSVALLAALLRPDPAPPAAAEPPAADARVHETGFFPRSTMDLYRRLGEREDAAALHALKATLEALRE